MKILVTCDGSAYSLAALADLGRLVRCEGAQLWLLLVVQRPAPAITDMIGPPYVDYGLLEQQLVAEGRDLLANCTETLKAQGLTPTALLKEGDPGDVILRTAKEEGIDLIVMGSHGRSGLTRFLLGSVSDRVLTHATCSVLVVKRPDLQKTGTGRL